MRLLICAGGTGGGVYPALAVVQERDKNQSDAILWVGSEKGMEYSLVKHAGLEFRGIAAAGIHGVGWKKLPKNIASLVRGFFDSRRILKDFKPEVLFFTGGYIGIPMAFAGIHIPQLIFIPDIEPGLSLKVLARLADTIAVVCDDSKKYLPSHKKIVVTGYPTRAELKKWTKENARNLFGLSDLKPVLFIFGGSKGARSINQAVANHIHELLNLCQIIHITGQSDWDYVCKVREHLDPAEARDYHINPYLHEEMGAAFAAADLVISRAGASTLGEFPLFGLPAILVPYPYAWRYQKVNADYLAEKGAAIIIEDTMLDKEIVGTVGDLMQNRDKLAEMKKAMSSLAIPDAAKNIAVLLEELAISKSEQS
ncbi:MAG TPA: undecaprenyldiphospho-muramoylpentapeptide beta-N-acetylglucosaminyltransferase [Flexilinea sp.]|nr:undecaprenyldiphospho-muramoylpentapeptide beta-N-acetylglucosaminyltransferase [Flexilinea sp.]